MNIEKIDVKKIRGKWSYTHSTNESIISDSGDDTISSIKIVANKINEIIDVLNEKKFIVGEDIEVGTAVFKSKIDGKIYMVKEDWEKEFDKISINLENIFQQIEDYERDGVEVFEVKDYIKKVKQFIRNLLK